MFKSLGGIVVIFGMAWAQKPADQGTSRGQQTPSAAASKPPELKTQTYKGTLMDASCAGAGKESSGGKAGGKPIRAKVTANANGDKLTVMSIN
jgi:hypothetical protein